MPKHKSSFRAVPDCRDREDFHRYQNGAESVEIMLVTADLTSSHLPKDLYGTLRLQRSTVRMSICDQLDDLHIDEEHCFRSISHFSLMVQVGLEHDGNEFLDLQKEWAGFLKDHVGAMI